VCKIQNAAWPASSSLACLRRIVHFDLKSANVLLGRDWTAKIADVGLAKILKDGWLSTLREVSTSCRLTPLPVY